MVYLILKLIHIVGVILFLGNITIAPFWKVNAEKSKDRVRVAEAWAGIIRADKFFTMPGVIIIFFFGMGAAGSLGYNIIETGWILWSLILFIVTGVVFMARVSPIQKKILKLVKDEANFNWDEYKKLSKQWDIWGSVATLAPWIAVILMVLKPNL